MVFIKYTQIHLYSFKNRFALIFKNIDQVIMFTIIKKIGIDFVNLQSFFFDITITNNSCLQFFILSENSSGSR